jgi:hypothetical protein
MGPSSASACRHDTTLCARGRGMDHPPCCCPLQGGDHVPSVFQDRSSRNSGQAERGPALPALGSEGLEFCRAVSVPTDAAQSIVQSVASAAFCCRSARDGACGLCGCLCRPCRTRRVGSSCLSVCTGLFCWSRRSVTPDSSSVSVASGPQKLLHGIGAASRGGA